MNFLNCRHIDKREQGQLLILLVLLCLASPFMGPPLYAHNYYVSICDIEYNQDDAVLEITLKFFTDDLDSALAMHSGEPPYLGTDREAAGAEGKLRSYLQKHFQMTINGEQVEVYYLGHEYAQELTYCYLEIPDVLQVRVLEIQHSCLIEELEGQTNLVHVRLAEQKKSMLLRKGHTSQKVEFE